MTSKPRTKKAQKELDNLTDWQMQVIIDLYYDEGYDSARKEFNLSKDAMDYIVCQWNTYPPKPREGTLFIKEK